MKNGAGSLCFRPFALFRVLTLPGLTSDPLMGRTRIKSAGVTAGGKPAPYSTSYGGIAGLACSAARRTFPRPCNRLPIPDLSIYDPTPELLSRHRAARLPRPFESPLPLSDPRRSTCGHGPHVPPGDDFFAYANGAWLKTPRSRPTAALGDGAIARRPHQPAHRRAHPGGGQERRPRAPTARKIGDYYASFMDEAAIEAKGLAPLKPDLATHRRHQATASALARVPGRRRCAPTSTRSTRPTSTPTTCSASGWRRTSTTRPATCRSCCRAGSACRTASYYLDRRRAWRRSAPSTRPHIADAEAGGHRGRATRRPRASCALETRSRRRTRAARTQTTCTRRNNHWTRERFRHQGAGARLARRSSPPRGLGEQATFIVWQPSAVTGLSALVASEPLDDLEGLPGLPRHRASRARAAQGLRRRALRLLRQGAVRHAQQRATAGSARWTPPTTRWARRSASSTSTQYFPPADKARAEAMVRTSSPPSAGASTRSTGWRRRPRPRPRRSWPCSRSASAIPTTGATTPPSTSCAGDAFGNAQRAELFEYQRNLAKLGQARGPRRVGDDAADGQRGQPAGA